MSPASDVACLGLLYRGDRRHEPPSPRAERRLAPLLDALAGLPVAVEPVVYSDDATEEVRAQLLGLDGVLVWVNPVQDGATRARLDALLRSVAAAGVFVSAHPDVVLELGTKEVLYRTRELGWGSDTERYASGAELRERLADRLTRHGRLVVKQGRGNGGNGVWLVERVPGGTRVRVQDARATDGSAEVVSLEDFIESCERCLPWSGVLVDQVFQDRLADGMVRCYLVHDEVVGFTRQWPGGLLDAETAARRGAAPLASVLAGAGAEPYQALRSQLEHDWVPSLRRLLGLDAKVLPVIWDADFLFGPPGQQGEDTYVLCEINVSAVWPFPPEAGVKIAEAAVAATARARRRRAERGVKLR